MILLLLVWLLFGQVNNSPPVPLGVFQTLQECQKAAEETVQEAERWIEARVMPRGTAAYAVLTQTKYYCVEDA